VEFVFVVGRQL